MALLERARHNLQIKEEIKYTKKLQEMAITLFGIKSLTVCHSAGSECHFHLNKSNQINIKGGKIQKNKQITIKTMS